MNGAWFLREDTEIGKIQQLMEEMANSPEMEILPGNSHWFDKNGKEGFSEYFWKSKYPCLLEATGHTPEEINNLLKSK